MVECRKETENNCENQARCLSEFYQHCSKVPVCCFFTREVVTVTDDLGLASIGLPHFDCTLSFLLYGANAHGWDVLCAGLTGLLSSGKMCHF